MHLILFTKISSLRTLFERVLTLCENRMYLVNALLFVYLADAFNLFASLQQLKGIRPPSTKGQQSCSRNALIEKSRQVRLASPVAMSFWNSQDPTFAAQPNQPVQDAIRIRDNRDTEIPYGTGFFRTPYLVSICQSI